MAAAKRAMLNTRRDTSDAAKRARDSFNQRFWFADGGYLFDVVDCNGESGTTRFVLPAESDLRDLARSSRARPETLVIGGRTSHKKNCLLRSGCVRFRPIIPITNQFIPAIFVRATVLTIKGTVWAWLIGPFVDAWLKVHPDDKTGARKFLETFPQHLCDDGIGTISEVFDAREPHFAGGCIAQAWSVAEVLRSWIKTA